MEKWQKIGPVKKAKNVYLTVPYGALHLIYQINHITIDPTLRK